MNPDLIPELGHLALTIALAFAICLSIVPLVGVQSPQQSSLKKLIGYAKPLTALVCLFLPGLVLLSLVTVLLLMIFLLSILLTTLIVICPIILR